MAPFYYEGVSDPADWPNQLKHPAPWGEIGSPRIVFALPRSSLKTAGDPKVVTTYWDKVHILANECMRLVSVGACI